MKHHIRTRRIVAAIGATAAAGAMSTAPAHAVPGPGPGMCQYLGANYPLYYECTEYQPWLPYGTADNPPMGGGLPDCTGVNLHNIGCS